MTPISTRRYDLDWLRIIAFLLLIFYHTGMFYVSWDWHVKSVHAGPDAEWLMRLLNPWRLSLLFFISGVALRFAADKSGSASLLKSRLLRLGLPILFGMILIVAPQSWLQLVETGEFEGNFAAFWPRYLFVGPVFSVLTPTWNHLWYVVYLLAYVLLIAPVSGPMSRFMAGRGEAICRQVFAGGPGVLAMLALPALPHMIYRLVLDPYFPTTHNLIWDWANHAHSLTYVLIGFWLAKSESFRGAVRRVMPAAISLAIGLGVVLSVLWAQWDALAVSEDWQWVIWPARMGRILYAWLVILSLIGLAQRYLNRPGPLLSYMTKAIFPWYILHQTLIILAGFWLTRQGLNVWAEFALVITATVAGCFLLNELIIRRVPVLRPLFGLPYRQEQARTDTLPGFQLSQKNTGPA